MLTRREIVAHCGEEATLRGEAMTASLLGVKQRGDLILAELVDEVALRCRARLHMGQVAMSRCTCPEGGACAHVAALLLSAIAPEQHESAAGKRREQPLSAPAPERGPALGQWLELHLPERLCLQPLYGLFRGLFEVSRDAAPWWDAWCHTMTLREVADPTVKPRVPHEVMSLLCRYLPEVSRRWSAADGYARRADSWRHASPETPGIAGLWEVCRPVLPSRGIYEIRDAHDWPKFRFARLQQVDQVPAVYGLYASGGRVAYDLVDAEGQITLQALPRELRTAFAGWFMDVFTRRPDLQSERGELEEALSRPRWQRQVAMLDEVLMAWRPEPASDAALQGWRVVQAGGTVEVAPVELTPLKSRAGFRCRKIPLKTLKNRDLHDVRDRAARAELQADKGGSGAFHAIRHLVGHPRVVDARGRVLGIREASLSLGVEEADGRLWVVPYVGACVVPAESRPVLWQMLEDGVFVWVDEAQRMVWFGTAGRPALELLRRLAACGYALDSEAREAVVSRLDRLEAIMPLRLSERLRGHQLEADPRLVVQLEMLGDGGLYASVRVRPLEGGATLRPGTGAVELSRTVSGQRWFVRRDLQGEVLAGRRLAHRLPSETLHDWSLTWFETDRALAALETLQQLGERVVVEWAGARRLQTVRVQPSDLKVTTRALESWLHVDGEIRTTAGDVPLAAVLDGIRRRRQFVRVDGDTWLHLTEELREALELPARAVGEQGGEAGLGWLAALTALRPLEDLGARVAWDPGARELQQKIQRAMCRAEDAPASLRDVLRPYQLAGFQWLERMSHWSPGACLADDMGLGKTLQALTLLLHRGDDGPALVVAPASVLVNWLREAERFTPGLDVRIYQGAARQAQLDGLGARDVLVCSYEILTRDREPLAAVGFHTAIFDEAQAIKNPRASRSRAAAELQAGFHVALSGTPVENRVGELWSLFRVIAPGLLDTSRRFLERYVRPIEMDDDQAARQALARLVAPFMLRRVKSEVAPELPPRTERVEYVQLSDAERGAYRSLRDAAGAAAQRGEAGRMQVLAALTRLRQLACARRLVDPEAPVTSSKISRLVDMLTEVRRSGERALVFSQFVQLLQLAKQEIESAGLTVCYLDGGMTRPQRQAQVDAFQAGQADVFLVSLLAGGAGLNLTAATWVFHLDPWWNPAKEDQASDRAHRIGQDAPVQVVRLVSAGTIEERVVALHAKKRALAHALVKETGDPMSWSADALMELLAEEVSGRPAPGSAAGIVARPAGHEDGVPAASEPDASWSQLSVWAHHDAIMARLRARLSSSLHDDTMLTVGDTWAIERWVERLLALAEREGGVVSTAAEAADWAERLAAQRVETPSMASSEVEAQHALIHLRSVL